MPAGTRKNLLLIAEREERKVQKHLCRTTDRPPFPSLQADGVTLTCLQTTCVTVFIVRRSAQQPLTLCTGCLFLCRLTDKRPPDTPLGYVIRRVSRGLTVDGGQKKTCWVITESARQKEVLKMWASWPNALSTTAEGPSLLYGVLVRKLAKSRGECLFLSSSRMCGCHTHTYTHTHTYIYISCTHRHQ